MKLNVKRRRPKVDDSWMHCCKYCHWYEGGVCVNKDITYSDGEISADYDDWFVHASEEGVVQEALSEALDERKIYSAFFDDILRVAISYGMRNNPKAMKEFKDKLKDVYDIFVHDGVPLLDSALVDTLHGYDLSWGKYNTALGLEISDPDTMCCDKWE